MRTLTSFLCAGQYTNLKFQVSQWTHPIRTSASHSSSRFPRYAHLFLPLASSQHLVVPAWQAIPVRKYVNRILRDQRRYSFPELVLGSTCFVERTWIIPLDVQAESLGLGDRWEKVKTAYAAANRALGDVVKASKSAATPVLLLGSRHHRQTHRTGFDHTNR